MIVLGIAILLIIAIAAGVGGGVAGTAAKSNAHNEALELTKSGPQDSSILTSSTPTLSISALSISTLSTPTRSSYAPQNYETYSLLVKSANMEIKQPITNIRLFVSYSYTYS